MKEPERSTGLPQERRRHRRTGLLKRPAPEPCPLRFPRARIELKVRLAIDKVRHESGVLCACLKDGRLPVLGDRDGDHFPDGRRRRRQDRGKLRDGSHDERSKGGEHYVLSFLPGAPQKLNQRDHGCPVKAQHVAYSGCWKNQAMFLKAYFMRFLLYPDNSHPSHRKAASAHPATIKNGPYA